MPAGARRTLARRLAACRTWVHHALHFLRALQRHMAANLHGTCWASLLKGLSGSGPRDVVQLARCHHEYLASAARACFLAGSFGDKADADSEARLQTEDGVSGGGGRGSEKGRTAAGVGPADDGGVSAGAQLQAAVATAIGAVEHFAAMAMALTDVAGQVAGAGGSGAGTIAAATAATARQQRDHYPSLKAAYGAMATAVVGLYALLREGGAGGSGGDGGLHLQGRPLEPEAAAVGRSLLAELDCDWLASGAAAAAAAAVAASVDG
jgi:hypothetical protein